MESNPYATPTANPYGTSASLSADAVSPGTIAALAGTKPWVRFISVMMWIGVVLMVLVGVLMTTVLGGVMATTQPNNPFGKNFGLLIGLIYIAMSFLYIYPALKLGNFASKIKDLMNSRSVADLDAALHQQRQFWKFLGVMMIVLFSLYVLIAIGAGVVGFMSASKGMH
jgi:hypothetical protein